MATGIARTSRGLGLALLIAAVSGCYGGSVLRVQIDTGQGVDLGTSKSDVAADAPIGSGGGGGQAIDAGNKGGAGGGNGGADGSAGAGGVLATGGTVGMDSGVAVGGSVGAGGTGGAGGTDATIGGGGSTGGVVGSGGGISSGGLNGSGGSPVTDASPDQKLPSSLGSQCLVNSDCALGSCVDGSCCDKACSGCNACKQSYTGKSDGTCAPVGGGEDPHNACTDETATDQCGNDGTCDGAGACRKARTSQVCTPAACNGAVFTPAATCDGLGKCGASVPENCGSFQCAAAGCLKTCTAQADCGATSYCNITTGTSGTCAAKKVNGAAATQTFECTGGIVADGVCCQKACTDCYACSGSPLTNGAAGQCLPVVANQVAHNACTASGAPCGLDGKCDGLGACSYSPKAGASCDDAANLCITGRTCQAGVCTGGTAKTCTPAACQTGESCSAGNCSFSNATDGTLDSTCPLSTQKRCYNGECVQCTIDSHCSGSTPSCNTTTHTCVCRVPSSGNVVKNPGFSKVLGLSQWHQNGIAVSYSNDDADGCADSGSAYSASDNQSDWWQCVTVLGSTRYYAGAKFKLDATSNSCGCDGVFNTDQNCTQPLNYGESTSLFYASQASGWQSDTSSFTTDISARSIYITCMMTGCKMDQVYINTTSSY